MKTKRLNKTILLTTAVFLTVIVALGFIPQVESNETVSVGPQKGTLVLVGGFATDRIFTKFINLAGGLDAPIVVIPTASSQDVYLDGMYEQNFNKLRRLGARNVTLLHTREKQVANSDSFVAPLLDAKGVWFGGGRQWRLVDAYKDTKTEEKLWEVLQRGGVIGGGSGGATIQGSYLVRGDTKNNQIMMGDHEEGFGFLKNTAIDQHALVRNRHFDMFTILKKHPELLGISIDEKTAIVVRGDWFEVIGSSYVMIYDGSFWSREGWALKELPPENERFYFLRAGDRYDLTNRKRMDLAASLQKLKRQ